MEVKSANASLLDSACNAALKESSITFYRSALSFHLMLEVFHKTFKASKCEMAFQIGYIYVACFN